MGPTGFIRRVFRRGGPWLATLLLGSANCGEALLPADYVGPPEAAIGGSVIRSQDQAFVEARTPQLALAWLAGPAGSGTPVITQSVAFHRSQQLRKDWDIELSAPQGHARMALQMGGTDESVGIGKLVYFDDRDGDGRLTWACAGSPCDEIKAISAEFVVYLELPVACVAGASEAVPSKGPMARGFHYFEQTEVSLRRVARDQDLRFLMPSSPRVWAHAEAGLREFAADLSSHARSSGHSVALGACE